MERAEIERKRWFEFILFSLSYIERGEVNAYRLRLDWMSRSAVAGCYVCLIP